jgi:hypothetical protein
MLIKINHNEFKFMEGVCKRIRELFYLMCRGEFFEIKFYVSLKPLKN